MSNINGSQPPGRNVTEGDSLGIGLTLDSAGDPIVLLWVEHQEEQYGVALTEQSAIALAQSLIAMASEITQMRDTTDITPEEMDERMREIIRGTIEGGEPQD